MAILKAFKAWRPAAGKEPDIVSVPYDVIDTDEARVLAEGKPLSFLRVIRPEIDCPKEYSIYDDRVYEQGRKNLNELLNSEHFQQEEQEALYIYRLHWKEMSQTGIFGCVSVEDYNEGVILKHELTRPDKEDDRTRHILTQRAHAEPVMMTFSSNSVLEQQIQLATENSPLYDFTSEDGVNHTIWKVDNPEELAGAFEKISSVYIADGHHRCASAARASAAMIEKGEPEDGEHVYFPAVLFPMKEMNILAYNRIIYSTPDDFIEQLQNSFECNITDNPHPDSGGEICLYSNGQWYRLSLPESNSTDVAAQLDVARLQEHILEPLLGITNQRTDKNINFVGGIRGTGALEELVDSGEADLAISLYPTSIRELVDVSDAGLLMPPKSTWFEPKLKSGFLIHTF